MWTFSQPVYTGFLLYCSRDLSILGMKLVKSMSMQPSVQSVAAVCLPDLVERFRVHLLLQLPLSIDTNGYYLNISLLCCA